MNHIYTITVITKDGRDSRCFGFYFTQDEALDAISENRGSMCECLYEYIVLEKQGQGIHAIYWFKWSVNPFYGEESEDRNCWLVCDAPKGEWFDGTINWSGIG
jgi:hypothetical protein